MVGYMDIFVFVFGGDGSLVRLEIETRLFGQMRSKKNEIL